MIFKSDNIVFGSPKNSNSHFRFNPYQKSSSPDKSNTETNLKYPVCFENPISSSENNEKVKILSSGGIPELVKTKEKISV